KAAVLGVDPDDRLRCLAGRNGAQIDIRDARQKDLSPPDRNQHATSVNQVLLIDANLVGREEAVDREAPRRQIHQRYESKREEATRVGLPGHLARHKDDGYGPDDAPEKYDDRATAVPRRVLQHQRLALLLPSQIAA